MLSMGDRSRLRALRMRRRIGSDRDSPPHTNTLSGRRHRLQAPSMAPLIRDRSVPWRKNEKPSASSTSSLSISTLDIESMTHSVRQGPLVIGVNPCCTMRASNASLADCRITGNVSMLTNTVVKKPRVVSWPSAETKRPRTLIIAYFNLDSALSEDLGACTLHHNPAERRDRSICGRSLNRSSY